MKVSEMNLLALLLHLSREETNTVLYRIAYRVYLRAHNVGSKGSVGTITVPSS